MNRSSKTDARWHAHDRKHGHNPVLEEQVGFEIHECIFYYRRLYKCSKNGCTELFKAKWH